MTRRISKIALVWMIAYDCSMHFLQLVFGQTWPMDHYLTPVFPSWEAYNIFWGGYWLIALALSVYLYGHEQEVQDR